MEHFVFLVDVSWDFEDPDPAKGDWTLRIGINMAALIQFEYVAEMFNFAFAVDRDYTRADWHLVTLDIKTTSYQKMRSEEIVVHKMDGSKEIFFKSTIEGENSLQTPYDPIFSVPGLVLLELEADLLVEHWEEYIHYGYVEWFMAMSGLTSFAIAAFFVIASITAKSFNNYASLGILPIFSIQHRNRVKIRELEETMKTLLELLASRNC